MAYVKTNWVDEVTPLSAANLNKIEQGVVDAHAGLADIRVRAHNNAAQGVAGSGANPSIMSFNTVDYDTDGMHPSGGSRFTAVHAGMYAIFAQLLPQQQPSGGYQMQLRANGTFFAIATNWNASSAWEAQIFGLHYMAVGEYLEFAISNLNAAGFQTNVDFVAVRVPFV